MHRFTRYSQLSQASAWKVTELPLPKRHRSAKAYGICRGFPAGESNAGGYSQSPLWWQEGLPVLLTVEGKKRISARGGHDDAVPGAWLKSDGDKGGAVGWRPKADGSIEVLNLHDSARYAWTFALGSGGGTFVGYGEPKVKKGQKPIEQALFWDENGTILPLPVPADENPLRMEAIAEATDGEWIVGNIGRTGGQQAALWNRDGKTLVFLGDRKSLSEAHGVRDGQQVGIRWGGMKSQAALWEGSPESFVGLNPAKFYSARALDCAAGLQVGCAEPESCTRDGSASLISYAALWNGTAASFVNLHQFVPGDWNASAAHSIEVVGNRVLIVGSLTKYSVVNELTSREHHVLDKEIAAVWEAVV